MTKKTFKHSFVAAVYALWIVLHCLFGFLLVEVFKHNVWYAIGYLMLLSHIATLGIVPALLIQHSFSLASYLWAFNTGLTCCLKVKRPINAVALQEPDAFKSRLQTYGRRRFNSEEAHVRGYCLNMHGSEIFGMAMATSNYLIGNYVKNYNGNDFGCSSKSWGGVRDKQGNSICFWKENNTLGCIDKDTPASVILAEMDEALRLLDG